MLPNNEKLRDAQLESDFLYPRNLPNPLYQSYELGGIALGDTSQGLNSFPWFARTDGNSIYIKRLDTDSENLILSDSNITEIDFTFDQNMNVCVTYISNGVAKLYYYDSNLGSYTTETFPDIQNPRVSLDDKRSINTSNSDIIFAYMKNNNLYMRVQRDKYLQEKLLKTFSTPKILWKIGMGNKNRFLFYVR